MPTRFLNSAVWFTIALAVPVIALAAARPNLANQPPPPLPPGAVAGVTATTIASSTIASTTALVPRPSAPAERGTTTPAAATSSSPASTTLPGMPAGSSLPAIIGVLAMLIIAAGLGFFWSKRKKTEIV